MTDEPMSDEHIARARRRADAVMRGEHDTTGMVADSLDMLLAEVERLRRIVGEPMPTEDE